MSDSDSETSAARVVTPVEIEDAYLMVFDGQTASQFRLPEDGTVVIGRAEDADVRIRSTSVSRRHARIVVSDCQARIEDLGSRNGVRVNGRRILSVQALYPADVIDLGTVSLVLCAKLAQGERTPALSMLAWRARAASEVQHGEPFTVLSAAFEPDVARVSIEELVPKTCPTAWDGDALVVLLPAATQGLESQLEEGLTGVGALRVGRARYPGDARDADALLAAAHAVDAAPPKPRGRTLTAGEHTIRLADASMIQLYALLEQLAASNLSVLIRGETGTGKELAALAVHHGSPRATHPFVPVNCAALPDTLAESELFGYERGAFSGAATAKPGLFETANGGTLFLDEVGELSAAVQAKLLRVLETGRLRRLGDVKERAVDVRVLAATHRDLLAEANEGRFRLDLYYRLSAATVWIPPLRDRLAELPLLAQAFLDEACRVAGREMKTLAPATRAALVAYRFPGNVRELKNMMHFVAATCPDRVVGPDRLPRLATPAEPEMAAEDAPFADKMRELEKRRMAEALAACEGNQTRAAAMIGMPRRTFVTKVRVYGLGRTRSSE
jgi:DNA-binding NtrC family response regulator/pSer/pThr/pTyr-binding forkhead associated (FHA) protein